MRRAVAMITALALTACTRGQAPGAGPVEGPDPTSPPPEARPISIPVIVTASGPDRFADRSYLEGMRVAQHRINADGGVRGRPLQLEVRHDHADDATTMELTASAVEGGPPVVLVVGGADAVAVNRSRIEAARVPVVLLGGDLYTRRALFRYAFQTSVPIRWQARVIATYLLEDQAVDDVVVLVDPGPDGEATGAAFTSAFAEEGSPLPEIQTLPEDDRRSAASAAGADAVVTFVDERRLGPLLAALAAAPDPALLVTPPSELQIGGAPRGSVLCYPYTWAGWAEMLPRVQSFRDAMVRTTNGLTPDGPEQEGYDAVMALAEALDRTGGEGGDALVRVLEGFREETYSSLPIRLGPDDHVFAEESHLGLFAVADPSGAPSGEAFGAVPWRPVMRTFTTDGEKVNLLDRDKRIFFPFWRPKRPTPKYWKSEYGIVTRRGEPPA